MKRKNMTSESTCAICFENLLEQTCTLDGCHHSFHSRCIWEWAIQQSVNSKEASCPVCRVSIAGCSHASVDTQRDGDHMETVLSLGRAHGMNILNHMSTCMAKQIRSLTLELQTIRDENMVNDIVRAESDVFATIDMSRRGLMSWYRFVQD